MYILNIASTIKKMSANELRDFENFENYYKLIGFVKEKSYYSVKRSKKICCYLQLIIRKRPNLVLLKNTKIKKEKTIKEIKEKKKNTKSVKQS